MDVFTVFASELYLRCIITLPVGYLINFSFFLILIVLPTLARVMLHLIALNDTHSHTHSAGLFWTRYQPVPETST